MIVARHDNGFAHGGMAQQRGLDLTGLDAKAAQLDLVVDAAQELEVAVRQITRKVSGPVEARAHVGTEGIGDEPIRRELRAVEIAARQAGAADMELAGNADRHGLQSIVEHVNACVRDGSADRHARSPLSALALPERRGHRRFGRSVAVVQIGVEACEEAFDELDGERFGARRNAPQTRARAQVFIEECAQQRRDEADGRDASPGDERGRMRDFANVAS